MKETQSIEIDVKLENSDIRRYLSHYYRKSILLLLISFMGAIFVFGFLITIFIPDNPFLSSFFVGLDPLIIFFALLVFILPIIIYFLLLYTAKKYGLLEKRIIQISNDDITIKTNTKNTTFRLNSVNQITETKNAFYIWQGKAPQILPKRFMESSDIEFVYKLKKDYI